MVVIGVVRPSKRPPSTRTPLTGRPVEGFTTRKVTVPFWDDVGTSNPGTGAVSASPVVDAEAPMPRSAKPAHTSSRYFFL